MNRLGARAFDRSRDVVYGLWPDFRLAYTNVAWKTFAVENDGRSMIDDWPLGRFVPDAFGPLKDFYVDAFRRALATNVAWEHTYACPSPALNRWYVMRVLPIDGEGLVVCHALVAQVARADAGPNDDGDGPYKTSTGLVIQCSHCRRLRAIASDEPDRWDFVPRRLERTSRRTSHALCPICVAYHYYKYLTPDELRAALEAAEETPSNGPARSADER
ncbi:MAG TPA: hypothetical protein VHJ20_11400 [Polyangia bacterium]|nr:hypothetical protein [Polyangia bacterium]